MDSCGVVGGNQELVGSQGQVSSGIRQSASYFRDCAVFENQLEFNVTSGRAC
jgi:hypothetical protein